MLWCTALRVYSAQEIWHLLHLNASIFTPMVSERSKEIGNGFTGSGKNDNNPKPESKTNVQK